MATPFIDILTPAQREIVSRKARGISRPSYYSFELAQGDTDADPGMIQISEDLEALLILLPREAKQGLLDFINVAANTVSSTSALDFQLFTEMVQTRTLSYGQVYEDSGAVVSSYDRSRESVVGFLEQLSHQAMGSNRADAAQTSSSASTEVVIPDLSTLFASLSISYDSIARPDQLAMHDRISDVGYLYSVQDSATQRSKELLSWVTVITTYMVA